MPSRKLCDRLRIFSNRSRVQRYFPSRGKIQSLKLNCGTESIVFNAIGSREEIERSLQKYAVERSLWIERLLYKINSFGCPPPLYRETENLENLEKRWQIGNLCNEGNIRHATSCACLLYYTCLTSETCFSIGLRNRLLDGQTTFFSFPLFQKGDQKSSIGKDETGSRNKIRCFINELNSIRLASQTFEKSGDIFKSKD